jgi:FKBP-type peptidyl-prolyl cis-trans isomerase
MKIQIVILSALVLSAPLVRAEDAAALKDEKAKVSYSIGTTIGMQWKRFGIEPDQISLEDLNRGIKGTMNGDKPLLTDPEMQEILRNFQQQVQAKQREKQRLEAEKNRKAGEAFLNENKTKPGVVTLPSGLQYKILTEGKGDSPKATDMVTVNYKGTLIDGTEFDSTAKHGGQPSQFGVTGVISGWTEALQLMKPGAKWQLFIPAELAYKDAPRPNIPPGSALIFEIELLSAQAAPPPATAQPVTSDIIKVPSADEMKKGAKIETIKAEDLKKLEEEAKKQGDKAKEKE